MTWHLLEGEHAAYIHAAIPPAALEGVPFNQDGDVTVVRHDYLSWRRLRERGLVIPSPISHFPFSGRYKPKMAQVKGMEFMLEHDRGNVILPARAGKTLATLWTLDYLLAQGVIKRALIVAPKTTCNHVWARTLFTEFPHIRFAVLEGTAKKKQNAALNLQHTILIVNYESLHLIANLLPQVGAIAADESVKVKTVGTRAWKALSTASQGKRLWLLTAAPTPQSPMDAYGALRLTRDKYMAFGQWREMTMLQVTRFKWVPKKDADQTIATWLQPAVRVAREDCVDLSGVQVIERCFDLSPEQELLCQKLRDEAAAELRGQQITAANAAVVFAKQMQVQSGGVYCYDAGGERISNRIDAQPFFDAIDDLIVESDSPVLIFTPFLASVKFIHENVLAHGHTCEFINKDVPAAKRSKYFDAIQKRELKVLVAVPETMKYGIDLFEARTVIWAAPPTSNDTYQQANWRTTHPTERTNVGIYHLVGSTLARRRFEALESKETLQNAVLELLS